jgi:hypothetical protein
MHGSFAQDDEVCGGGEAGVWRSRHRDSLRSSTLSVDGPTNVRQCVRSLHEQKRSRLLGDVMRGDGQAVGAMIRTNVKQLPKQWLRPLALSSAFITGIFASLSFVAGCENRVSAYCVARCDCQGCSQVERADCLDDVEDSERLAEHDGCATEFSDYLSCYADEGTCNNGGWVSSMCTTRGTVLRNCSSRSATFVKTACEEEKDKRASCGLSGGGSDPCAGVDECVAFCALGASCTDLAGVVEGSPYVNCVINCSSSNSSSGTSSGLP